MTKRKAQLRALHTVLDLIETYNATNQAHVTGSAAKLYAQMLVGTLIRGMSGRVKVPKSIRRAKALGIAVFSGEQPPKHEREKILRYRLTRGERLKAQREDTRERYRSRYGGDDRDGDVLV